MMRRTFVVTNKLGLHARPASLFVQAGAKMQASVKVSKSVNGEEVVVNGKSVMGLMLLAAACGEEITVMLDGPDEEEGMQVFAGLFKRKFEEE